MTVNYTYNKQTFTYYENFKYLVAIDELVHSEIYSPAKTRYILTIIHVILFVIGLIGNPLTIAVIISNKSMHTVCNYYLVNLAVADLLFLLIIVPLDIVNQLGEPAMNVTLCYLKIFLEPALIFLAAITIVAIAVEGYVFMCRPLDFTAKPSTSRAYPYIFGIWLLTILCGYLEMYLHPIEENNIYTCSYQLDRLFVNLHVFIFFFLPISISTVLYTLIGIAIMRSDKNSNQTTTTHHRQTCSIKNSKKIDDTTKNILKMLVTIAAAVFLCWTPYHVIRVLIANRKVMNLSLSSTMQLVKVIYILQFVANSLVVLNTAMKPLVYCLMLKKFRRAYKEILKRMWHRIQQFWNRSTEFSECRQTAPVSKTIVLSEIRKQSSVNRNISV